MHPGSSCPRACVSQEGGHSSISTSSASWAPVTLVPPAEGHDAVLSYALYMSAWAQRRRYRVSNVLRPLALSVSVGGCLPLVLGAQRRAAHSRFSREA